ncbi:hypothetical protein CDEF62S_05130 [Castellaniella defragrans]
MNKILETIDIGAGVQLARAIQAGRWIFTQGNMATLHAGGLCTEAPSGGGRDLLLREPPGLAQGRWILRALDKTLAQAGASLDDLVRVDQYYDRVDSVHPYHLARQEVLTGTIPPSTSIIVENLLTPGATLCLEALAAVDGHLRREAISEAGTPMPRASSGFAPVMKLDEFVFIAGQVADSMDGSGIATEATMNPEFVWDGSEIARQTQYVLDNLFRAAETAGSDRQHLVKAQVYLRSMEDLPEFNQVWRQNFGTNGPARTVAPASGLALRKGKVEINLIGVTRETPVVRDPSSGCFGVPLVVQAADMIHFSGISAEEDGRLAASVSAADRDRYVRSVAAVETEAIVDALESRLGHHGRSLKDVARIIQFHTDLSDFLPSVQVWHRRLGGPVPISAVQVHGPLAPSSARILADCWAVAA